ALSRFTSSKHHSGMDMKQIPTIGHFIGGRLVEGGIGKQAVFNPAIGEVESEVWLADAREVELAVSAAKAAATAWADTAPLKRARILFRFKELIERHHD